MGFGRYKEDRVRVSLAEDIYVWFESLKRVNVELEKVGSLLILHARDKKGFIYFFFIWNDE